MSERKKETKLSASNIASVASTVFAASSSHVSPQPIPVYSLISIYLSGSALLPPYFTVTRSNRSCTFTPTRKTRSYETSACGIMISITPLCVTVWLARDCNVQLATLVFTTQHTSSSSKEPELTVSTTVVLFVL